jgi:SpoVK/Ycf46/Vps4 family AAA+-type ATPase
MFEKIQKPQETKQDHVQGCGDPNCQICMPKGGSGGGSKVSGDDVSWIVPDGSIEDVVARELLFRAGRLTFSGVDTSDPKRAARDKERELRRKVEQYLLKTQHSLAWDDVIGNEAARTALVEAIEHPLVHKDLYAHYQKKPTKGVLLYGAPGNGKTMFGKAAASILAKLNKQAGDVTMLSIKGPSIQSPYVGVTEGIIRDIFAYAAAYKALHDVPLVVFIDEADSILPSRDGSNSRRALPWEESNVATFLAEMDGLDESGALVILATNRPESIDAAILRDGRCDRKIKVERPDEEASRQIILRNLVHVPLSPGETAEECATYAAGYLFDWSHRIARLKTDKGPDFLTLGHIVSGAMVVGLVEVAKGVAFRRDLAAGGVPTGICKDDIRVAIDTVFEQNRGLTHEYALRDYIERHDIKKMSMEFVRVEYPEQQVIH